MTRSCGGTRRNWEDREKKRVSSVRTFGASTSILYLLTFQAIHEGASRELHLILRIWDEQSVDLMAQEREMGQRDCSFFRTNERISYIRNSLHQSIFVIKCSKRFKSSSNFLKSKCSHSLVHSFKVESFGCSSIEKASSAGRRPPVPNLAFWSLALRSEMAASPNSTLNGVGVEMVGISGFLLDMVGGKERKRCKNFEISSSADARTEWAPSSPDDTLLQSLLILTIIFFFTDTNLCYRRMSSSSDSLFLPGPLRNFLSRRRLLLARSAPTRLVIIFSNPPRSFVDFFVTDSPCCWADLSLSNQRPHTHANSRE